MLEEKDRNFTNAREMLEALEESNDDNLAESQNEIHSLRSNNERLELLLAQAREELTKTKEQSKRSREHLEDELRRATETSHQMEEELDQIRQELKTAHSENSNVRTDLDELKERIQAMTEELIKSQKEVEISQNKAHDEIELTIREEKTALEETMAEVEERHIQRVNELEEIIESLATEKKTIQETMEQSHQNYEQKIAELHEFIDALATEKEAMANELETIEMSLNTVTREFEEERSKYEGELVNLRQELESSNEENVDLSKELQHSRQLFREALVAWRVETRDLTHQIDMLKGTEQWSGTTSPRDSFSVQSSQQNFQDSAHSRKTYESYKSGESVEFNSRDAQVIDEVDGSIDNQNQKELPGTPQAKMFFNRLLQVDTQREGQMNGPDFIDESPAHQSQSSMNTFPPDYNQKRVSWKSDEESVGTNNGSTTSMQRKIVRWKDEEAVSGANEGIYHDELSQEDSNNRPLDSTNENQIEERNLEDEQNVQYEDRETREDYWETNRIDRRDDEVRSIGSQVIGASSIEDGSLRGSSLLPPRQSYSNGYSISSFVQSQQGGRIRGFKR